MNEESKDSLSAFLEAIQGETYRPYKTDIPFFDDLLGGGLIRGTLTILLAAPGAGKTALCAQIGEAIAEHGRQVLYLNLEMTGDQMLARSISGRVTLKGTPISAMQVMQGYSWTDEQRDAITKEIEDYRKNIYPYMQYYGDTAQAGIDEIKALLDETGARMKAAGQEAPAVILDYLHLVTGAGDPQEMIKTVTFMLKKYAEDNSTIAIAIAAVNRDSMNGGIISMTSGRDSSGLEFTADYLLGLNYYECDTPAKIKQGDTYITNPEHVDPKDPEAMGQLLEKDTRRMILRVLKGRFISPGKKAKLQFYAPAARFYPEGAFTPAGKSPFDSRPVKRR